MHARIAQSVGVALLLCVGVLSAQSKTAFKISPASATVETGKTVQLSAIDARGTTVRAQWSSSAPGVAVVNGSGLVTGVAAGKATISAKNGPYRGSATVTVSAPAAAPAPAPQPAPAPAPSPGADSSWVHVYTGNNLQSLVDQYPAGTTFYIRAGVHRGQRVRPKSGNRFIGESGAILSGARLLTTFSRQGSYWFASGQTQNGLAGANLVGRCQPAFPRCLHPEELFIDNVPLRHVSSLSQVGPGKWFFDYSADRIYFWDDPTGKRVETSVTPYAFDGSAQNVIVEKLVMEKYANRAQVGVIQGHNTVAWIVRDNVIRLNHGVGIRIGTRMQVLRNKVLRNGQIGVSGVGDDVLVEGNEIAHNNFAGYTPSPEAGGTKFARTRRLVVRNNFVHHNDGPGLWTDIDNIYTLYEQNTVEDNTYAGIFHEVSYDAVIRNNIVRRNGTGAVIRAGIRIAAASNVVVHGNLVEHNGRGIEALQQNRGSGAYGPYRVSNLHVHSNTVRMTVGYSGLWQDVGDLSYFTSRNNRFEKNTYYLGPNAKYFLWMASTLAEDGWRAYGQDVDGKFVR